MCVVSEEKGSATSWVCFVLQEERGSLKRSARAVQLFGCLAVLETHTWRY